MTFCRTSRAQGIDEWKTPSPLCKIERKGNLNERTEHATPIGGKNPNGFAALVGTDGNEGMIHGKAPRVSKLPTTTSARARRLNDLAPARGPHPVSCAQGANVMPEGSVSAGGWFCWPKSCWPGLLCFFALVAIGASGAALVYSSYVSGGVALLNSISDATSPPAEIARDLAAINARFLSGRPADDLHDVGLIVRHADPGAPWLPSTGVYDGDPGLSDRMSGSIINARLPYTFSNSAVGIILNPARLTSGATPCACAGDCGSYRFGKGKSLLEQCEARDSPGRPHHYRDLAAMLKAHESSLQWRETCVVNTVNTPRDRNGCRYNEVFLDAVAVGDALPSVVEAVFLPINAGPVDRVEGSPVQARNVRDTFARAFGMQLPLLTFDVRAAQGGRAPFAMMDLDWGPHEGAAAKEEDGADATDAPGPLCVAGRQLPELFLLGAQKCGTTSLARQLVQHGVRLSHSFDDGIAFSNGKEPHFFNTPERYERGIEHYASIFPPCGRDVLTMDATPDYLLDNSSLGRLASMYGSARLERTTFAVLLCEPLQRAQSAFYHMKSHPVAGIATPSSATFSDFVKDDADDPHPLWAHGQYGPQLDGILAQLGQIAIVPTAWYLAAAGPTITGLLSLVQRRSGKRSQRPPLATLQGEARHENAGKHPLLATEITSPVERQSLSKLFQPSNERVYELAYGEDPRVSLLPHVSRPSTRFLEPSYTELVSIVVLVTPDRAGYLKLALEQVRRQTYPRLEVVVVNDLGDDISGGKPGAGAESEPGAVGPIAAVLGRFPDLDVTYRHVETGSSVGYKRNVACSLAQGSVIVTWDSDDLYSDTRVATQVAPILGGKYDASVLRFRIYAWVGTNTIEYYENPWGGPNMGTLTFRRSLWADGAGYPEVDIGEDIGFLDGALQECACSTILPGTEGVYTRHLGGRNTWGWNNASVGVGPNGQRMRRIDRPGFLPDEIDGECIRAEQSMAPRRDRARTLLKYAGSRRNLALVPFGDLEASSSMLPARCLASESAARGSCPVETKRRELRRLLVDGAVAEAPPSVVAFLPPPPPPPSLPPPSPPPSPPPAPPPKVLVQFAVTSGSRCAESLPYGPEPSNFATSTSPLVCTTASPTRPTRGSRSSTATAALAPT